MKKIFSLGIASAVLAMTALSASANVVVSGPEAIKPGDTVTVEFKTDADIAANSVCGFKVVATGVKFESKKGGTYGEKTGKFGFLLTDGAKAGDVLGSITYTVTAKDGEAVSINVTDLEGFGDGANVTPLQVTVKAEAASTPDSTTSSDTSSTTSSDTSSTTSSGTTSKPDDGKAPNTGIALAVFPAIIAGAAVVVAKKKNK